MLILLIYIQMSNPPGYPQQSRAFQPLSFPMPSFQQQQASTRTQPPQPQQATQQGSIVPTAPPVMPVSQPFQTFQPLQNPLAPSTNPAGSSLPSQNSLRSGFQPAYSGTVSHTSSKNAFSNLYANHNQPPSNISHSQTQIASTSYSSPPTQSITSQSTSFTATAFTTPKLSSPTLGLQQPNVELLTLPRMNTLMIQMDKEMTYLDAAKQQRNENRGYASPSSPGTDNKDTMAALECGEISLNPNLSEVQSCCARCEELAQQIIGMCATTRQQSTNLDTVMLTKMRGLEALARDALRLVESTRKTEQEKSRQREIREKLFETSATQQVLNRQGEAGLAALSREYDHLSAGLRTITDTIAAATSSLSSLQRQHQLLKGVQRKVLDLATSLGMSRRVLQWIDRQESVNTIIAFGGMVIVLIVVFFFYYWWTSPTLASS